GLIRKFSKVTNQPYSISPVQRRYLKNLSSHEGRTPSVFGLLKKSLPRLIPLILVGVLIFGLRYLDISSGVLTFFLVVVVGALVMVIWMFRLTVDIWPVSQQITDWKKVQELLEKADA